MISYRSTNSFILVNAETFIRYTTSHISQNKERVRPAITHNNRICIEICASCFYKCIQIITQNCITLQFISNFGSIYHKRTDSNSRGNTTYTCYWQSARSNINLRITNRISISPQISSITIRFLFLNLLNIGNKNDISKHRIISNNTFSSNVST